MVSDSEIQRQQELERHAYNAAFHELGFRWYWDRDTFEQLMRRATSNTERIRHYLETHQPHLLRAYDSTFLVVAIEAAKVEQARRGAAPEATLSNRPFDWAQMSRSSELGA